jgi:hypothetical protein
VSFLVHILSRLSFAYVLLCAATLAQEPAAKPADAAPPNEKTAAPKSEEKAALPFQIQLLETHIRFESNGDSRKEVHTIVKINDLAGARQFSRLGFDYNRAFQQVEIPLVKVSHANGGTSEILPSAITDALNPAVQDFPAYQDVRVKSVRILALEDGDTIEYRVITKTTKHPLAPDFWLEHTFDRSGQVLEERYVLTLPQIFLLHQSEYERSNEPSPLKAHSMLKKQRLQMYVSPEMPPTDTRTVGDDLSASLVVFSWNVASKSFKKTQAEPGPLESLNPDIVISTYSSWAILSSSLSRLLAPNEEIPKSIQTKVAELSEGNKHSDLLSAIYDLVSHSVLTVDLPLGSTGFRTRPPDETLASGYGTPEDKIALFSAMLRCMKLSSDPLLVSASAHSREELPRPSVFNALLMRVVWSSTKYFLDPNLEVAPLGMIRLTIRGTQVLPVDEIINDSSEDPWTTVPSDLPFAARQAVEVTAHLSTEGRLSATVKYQIRGDNELVLRVAFHQTPKERWKEVAGLLALSDGFRGAITSVTASDPMATKDPFTVEYEITQAKFVDWSKKPVRIPALLPQIALPDAPGKTAGKIELGTPLDVQTSLKLQLPQGTTVQTPAATSVVRDYAAFASKYDGHLNTVTVSRHIHFVMREIPIERAGDYNTFLRAVQNDQAQALVLLPPGPGAKQ